MASAKCLVPVDIFRSKFYSDCAGGTRAMFILGSVTAPPSDDVVSRLSVNLTDEDRQVLSSFALPPDRWTDLEVIIARNKQVEGKSIDNREISEPSQGASCRVN